MSADQPTEQRALVFGQRLDTVAAGLTPLERTLLSTILHDAEAAQHHDVDNRTPRDIPEAIQRTYDSTPISRNPQPMPSGQSRFPATRRDTENPDYAPHPEQGVRS